MFHYINLKALFYCLGKNAGIGIQFQYIFGFMGMNDLQEVILYLIGISFFIKYFLFKKFLYICVLKIRPKFKPFNQEDYQC